MIIYVHRKHFAGNTFIEEDEAERIYRNVCNIEVCKSYIFGDGYIVHSPRFDTTRYHEVTYYIKEGSD